MEEKLFLLQVEQWDKVVLMPTNMLKNGFNVVLADMLDPSHEAFKRNNC